MTKLHRKLSFTLTSRPKESGETKHAVKATVGMDGEVLRAILGVVDDGVTLIEQAHEIPLELVGGSDGRFHQRLKHLWYSVGKGLPKRLLSGNFKC